MKYASEYRDPRAARRIVDEISRLACHPWTLMELCGGQTHAIVRSGIDQMLPSNLTIIHGPGCPVCVTSIDLIDRAIAIARLPNVTLVSFGDMLRVPGSHDDLLTARAGGADVRVVYSPLDALPLALSNPSKELVFFGVGFETTAPATAMLVRECARRNIANLSVLVSHVLVPPVVELLLSSPRCRVQGLLAAGHVATITGTAGYVPIATRYRVPIVVCGFEPLDILEAIRACVSQLEEGRHEVENAYARVARREGNLEACRVMDEVYVRTDQDWRGIGVIPESGLMLRPEYARFDASNRFGVSSPPASRRTDCYSGEVLQGFRRPHECPSFGLRCTPDEPLGAPMVSAEGACAAWYRYRGGGLECPPTLP